MGKPESRAMKMDNMTQVFKDHEELKCKSMEWYIQNIDVELDWEKDKLCTRIGGPDRCIGEVPIDRSTIAKKDLMPEKEYKKARKAADARLKAEAKAERTR